MISAGRKHKLASSALFLSLLCSNAFAGGNLVRDGSFEKPVVPNGGFTVFSTGQEFGPHWAVVGATGNVAVASGTAAQGGFTFPAKKGAQWLDLTGTSNTATGVQQTISTVAGENYALTFYIGNIYDPGGPYGTASTVDVQIDGADVALFTNKCGKGSTMQCWRKYSTDFVASGSKTTIGFINGDSPNDNENGLDAVMVAPDPD